MGDSFVYFVSRDPHFAPAPGAVEAACALVRRVVTKRDGFDAKLTDHVEFFVNYEGGFKARCPRCVSAQPEAELMAWIDEDYREGAGFALAPRAMACCGATLNLNELDYDPPAAFARFAIKLQNVRWGFEDDLPTAPAWRDMMDEYRRTGRTGPLWNQTYAFIVAEVQAEVERLAVRVGEALGAPVRVVWQSL